MAALSQRSRDDLTREQTHGRLFQSSIVDATKRSKETRMVFVLTIIYDLYGRRKG